MKFYTKQHQFYCGVDLHADAMYVCILDATGEIVVHQNIPTKPKSFLRLARIPGTPHLITLSRLFLALSNLNGTILDKTKNSKALRAGQT